MYVYAATVQIINAVDQGQANYLHFPRMETDNCEDSAIFRQLADYPWDSDTEFQDGLAVILHPNSSEEPRDDLVLRAQCFYFARCLSLHIVPPQSMSNTKGVE